MIERLRTDAFGAGAAPFDADADRHHELMHGVPEYAVLERGVQVLKSVGSRCRWIHRAEEGVSRAERYREIFGDPFGELSGYIALPHRRNVAGLEAVDRRKGQFIVDAGIVDAERGGKEAIADDFVGDALTKGNERYGEPGKARAPKANRHGNSPIMLNCKCIDGQWPPRFTSTAEARALGRSSQPARLASGRQLPAMISAGTGAAALRK